MAVARDDDTGSGTGAEHKLCVTLVRRPEGAVSESCFAVEERPIEPLAPGEVLVRNLLVSCDPYLRLRMDETAELGQPVVARAVGEVAASADARFAPGEVVWGFLGWESFSTVPGSALTRIDPSLGPLSHAISVRGMIGLTAWVGVFDVLVPQPGETVVVSAGAGAVGSLAGQLARLAGARSVGIVGGPHKVRHATEFLGYDAVLDHRSGTPLDEQLGATCPEGVDAYFDNVGGKVLDAVSGHLNDHARLAMCGNVSSYDGDSSGRGFELSSMLERRASARWFSIYDHLHRLDGFVSKIAPMVSSGQIVYHEHITDGLETVPAAFLGLFRGDNLGKRLVRIAERRS